MKFKEIYVWTSENSQVTSINDMKELFNKCLSMTLYTCEIVVTMVTVVTMATVIEALSLQNLCNI
jgi:hypothetical protein